MSSWMDGWVRPEDAVRRMDAGRYIIAWGDASRWHTDIWATMRRGRMAGMASERWIQASTLDELVAKGAMAYATKRAAVRRARVLWRTWYSVLYPERRAKIDGVQDNQ